MMIVEKDTFLQNIVNFLTVFFFLFRSRFEWDPFLPSTVLPICALFLYFVSVLQLYISTSGYFCNYITRPCTGPLEIAQSIRKEKRLIKELLLL